MNNKIKIFVALIYVLIIFAVFDNIKVNALENLKLNNTCSNEYINKLTTINYNEKIKIFGIDTELYCVFENQDVALNKIKKEASNILELTKNEYNLNEFDKTNWKDYYDNSTNILTKLMQEDNLSESINKEFKKLQAFFDIYENKYQNDEIKQYVLSSSINDFNIKGASSSKIYKYEDIIYMLPTYSKVYNLYNKMKMNNVEIKSSSSYNGNAAANYAIKYATSPNYSGYGVLTSDCTNFSSQALNAGGISQIYTGNTNSGWWHYYDSSRNMHLHSKSWAYADKLAKYRKTSYTTTSVNNFSKHVGVGKIIAQDKTNDGDWEHTAVVVQTSNTLKTAGYPAIGVSEYYLDFKVAQHNPNYNRWASDGNCGWDMVGFDGGKFGILNN